MKIVKNEIKRVRIIRNDTTIAKNMSEELARKLVEGNFEVVKENPDLVVFIGGDGTFLSGCQIIDFNEDAMCVGMNAGKLGILQNYDGTIEDFVRNIKENEELNIEDIPYLDITVYLKYSKPINFKAINEVSLVGDALSLIRYRECVDNVYLQEFCSSGVIVSSTIGSTGIAKDYGASIVMTDEKLLVRTIVGGNSYKLKNVLPNSIICREYRVNVEEIYKNAKFQIDGIVQENINVEDILSIDVKYSDKTIKLLSLNKGNNRVDVIREKLINS